MSSLILARAVTFLCGALLLGIPAVLAVAVLPPLQGEARLTEERLPPVLSRLLRILWGAGVLGLLSSALWFLLQAATISGRPVADAASPAILFPVLWRTQFGHAMLARLALTLLALGAIAIAAAAPTPRRRRIALGAVAAIAAADFVALAWAGHAVATPGVWHLVADSAHLLAAGLWLGGLVVLAVLFAAGGGKGDASWIAAIGAATRRFSHLGLACVAVLLASGIVNSWFLVGTIPALVGTAYGQLLLVKIALFAAMVAIAAVNRLSLTPRIAMAARTRRNGAALTLGRLHRNTLAELILGGLVLLIVGALGAIAPGLHDQSWWPFAYRYGGDALALPEIRFEIVMALAAVTIGLALCLAGAVWRRHRLAMILIGLALLGFFLPSFRILLVAAYPTSFYVSPVAYTTASIARGARLYPANCASCHGAAGRGDGPAAAGLKVPPADLTAAHVLDHSAGDIFWWLSAGIGESGMPGFADRLSEDERWDLVNWVRTLPVGGPDGGLTAAVGDTSGAAAPDFTFDVMVGDATASGTGEGGQDTLRNRLAGGPLLVVFLAPDAAPARLQQLAAAQPALAQQGCGLLILATNSPASMPPGTAGSVDAATASVYALLAGLHDEPPDDLEFLVDRNGNARAVWQKGATPGWEDGTTLLHACALLAERPLAPSAPPAHIH